MVSVTRRRLGVMVAGMTASIAMVSGLTFAASAEQNVVVGIQGSSLIKLDPGLADQVRGELSAVRAIYSALTQIDTDGGLKPDLALEWNQVDDLTWEFNLREDAKFTNGVGLTAEHVVFSIDRLKDPANNFPSTTTNQMDRVAKAEAVGDYVVRITTNGPFFELPARLSNVYILEPGWTAENNPAVDAMGSGPYKLESFQRDQSVTLVANDDFYGTAPAVKNFTFRSYGNDATKKAAFQAGEIQGIAPVDPSDIEEFRAAGFVVDGRGSNRSHILRVNMMQGPLGDARVRKALNLGINRELIAEAIYFGMVDPLMAQPLSPAYPDYQADFESFPYDPEQAKALLAEAGYENGFEVTLSIPSGIYVGAADASQVIASQLAEIGVRVKVESIPMASWLDQLSKEETAPGLSYHGTKSNSNIANEILTQMTRKANYTHGTDEQMNAFEEAVDMARAATTEEERNAATKRALEIARDDAMAVYLWPQVALYAHDADLVWPARADDVISPQDITFASQ